MKVFTVELRGFGKHIVERVEADSREAAQRKVMEKYGVSVTVKTS